MSFDIFLQRFEGGEAAAFDAAAVHSVLDPVATEVDGGFARMVTADGEADVYGLDGDDALMVNHASGEAIWDLLIEVARAGGLTVMTGDGLACVVDEAALGHLPEGLPAEVVGSGPELRELLARS